MQIVLRRHRGSRSTTYTINCNRQPILKCENKTLKGPKSLNHNVSLKSMIQLHSMMTVYICVSSKSKIVMVPSLQ